MPYHTAAKIKASYVNRRPYHLKGGDTMDKLLMLLAFVALATASVMIRLALLHWVLELLK